MYALVCVAQYEKMSGTHICNVKLKGSKWASEINSKVLFWTWIKNGLE